MENQRLHDLIGDIYEAAVFPDKWTYLVHQLTDYLDLQSNTIGASVVSQNHAVASSVSQSMELVNNYSTINKLSPSRHIFNERAANLSRILNTHFERAISIHKQHSVKNDTSVLLKTLFNRIPIPLIILDAEKEIQFTNGAGKKFLQDSEHLDTEYGKLKVQNRFLQKDIEQKISQCLNDKVSNLVSLNKPNSYRQASLVITPANYLKSNVERLVAVLVANYDNCDAIAYQGLKTTYNITPAEFRLIEGLIHGQSLKEISTTKHVAMGTLRTQLKSIFAKMDVSRQAEVVRKTLLGAHQFIAPEGTPTQKNNRLAKSNLTNCNLTLSDGRTLGFAEFGDPKGKPVVGLHPITGSRFQCHPALSILEQLGIRFIVPDRPGFGLSSPQKHRQYADWPKDLAELLDHLNIDNVSMLSYCGGTPYALSSAVLLKQRVKQLLLVSPVTPYDKIDLLFGLRTPNRILINIASRLPKSLFQIGRIIANSLLINPDKYFDEIVHQLCDSDAAALNEPEFLENFYLALSESLKQGPTEFIYEQELLVKDWKIEAENIQCDTIIWHGKEDKHVPYKFSERFASTIPSAQFRLMPEHGHFMIYHLWKDIMLEVSE